MHPSWPLSVWRLNEKDLRVQLMVHVHYWPGKKIDYNDKWFFCSDVLYNSVSGINKCIFIAGRLHYLEWLFFNCQKFYWLICCRFWACLVCNSMASPLCRDLPGHIQQQTGLLLVYRSRGNTPCYYHATSHCRNVTPQNNISRFLHSKQ